MIRTVQILAPGYADQPRGHRRPPLVRDRGACGSCLNPGFHERQPVPPWWCWPRCAMRFGWSTEAGRLPDRGLRGGRSRWAIIQLLQWSLLARCWRWTSTGSCTRGNGTGTRTCSGSRTHRLALDLRHARRRHGQGRRLHRRLDGRLSGADELATMADRAIVSALANPDPEVDPAIALGHAAVVATARSDYPNQIKNVLAFPVCPRPARRTRPRHDRRHAAGRRGRDRQRGDPAEPLVHRAQRVRRRRGARGGRSGTPRRDPQDPEAAPATAQAEITWLGIMPGSPRGGAVAGPGVAVGIAKGTNEPTAARRPRSPARRRPSSSLRAASASAITICRPSWLPGGISVTPLPIRSSTLTGRGDCTKRSVSVNCSRGRRGTRPGRRRRPWRDRHR